MAICWTSSLESIHSKHNTSYVVVGLFHLNSNIVLVLLRAWAVWGCQRRVAMMLISSYSVYLLVYIIQVFLNTTALTGGSSQLLCLVSTMSLFASLHVQVPKSPSNLCSGRPVYVFYYPVVENLFHCCRAMISANMVCISHCCLVVIFAYQIDSVDNGPCKVCASTMG